MDTRIHQFRKDDFFRPGWPVSVHLDTNRPEEYPAEYTRLNQRQFWKIMYIVKGSGTMIVNGRQYSFSSGFVGLIHPLDLTTFELTESIELYNILFQRDFIEQEIRKEYLKEEFFSIFSRDTAILDPARHDVLHLLDSNRTIYTVIRKMHREYKSNGVFAREFLKIYLLELLYSLARQSFSSSLKNRRAFAAEYIRSALKKNYANPPDVRSLMRDTGLTRNGLFRLYKSETGETMGETIRRLRLEHAIELLKNTALPTSEICAMAGFPDLSNFYRLFRKTTGHSPGFYRSS